MSRRAVMRVGSFVLTAVVALALLPGVYATAASNIDPVKKWAWGSNTGWLNFGPTHGGVTVYADHLEGYVWGENIGWIRMGTFTGGGAHTYGNTTAANYGVNRTPAGPLEGYAWGTNVGWVKFNPMYGGVTIDPGTGSFDGYAWGENVGWIHFKGMRFNPYNVAIEPTGLEILLPFITK